MGALGRMIVKNHLRGEMTQLEGEDPPKAGDSPPPRELKDPYNLVGAQEDVVDHRH